MMEPVFKEEKTIYRNGYPCTKCPQNENCGAEHGCLLWRDWFRVTWSEVRAKLGKF